VATVAAAAVLGVVAALASAASNKPTITFVSPDSHRTKVAWQVGPDAVESRYEGNAPLRSTWRRSLGESEV
jgi:hypothetical protein